MFENIAKNKAVLYGGGIFVVVVLVLLFRSLSGGSSAAVTNVTAATDPNVLASQTQLALAQISAGVQTNANNAQLAAATLQAQNDLAEHTIDAAVTKYSIDAQTQQLQLQTAAAEASDARNANLQASIAKWTLDQAEEMAANNNAFQLTYAANANASAESIAQMNATLLTTQIKSNETVTIANLQSQAAQIASYLGAQVAINDSNNSKDVTEAQISANASKHSSNNNLIGSVVGGLFGLFSDPRLKRDVVLIANDDDGYGVYSYRYHDDASYQIGVMADEIAAVRPDALGPVISGYRTVNYAAL